MKLHWPCVLFTMFKMSTMHLRNVVRCSKFCQGLRYWLTLDYKILNLHDCVNWILPPWPNFEQNCLFRETKFSELWFYLWDWTYCLPFCPKSISQDIKIIGEIIKICKNKQTNKQTKKVLRKFSWSLWPLKYFFFCPALSHFSTDLIKKGTNCSGDHTTSNTGHL